jgi:hypothetical protein
MYRCTFQMTGPPHTPVTVVSPWSMLLWLGTRSLLLSGIKEVPIVERCVYCLLWPDERYTWEQLESYYVFLIDLHSSSYSINITVANLHPEGL